MELKHILYIIPFLFTIILLSCSNNNQEYINQAPSSDAQIYGLNIDAKPYTHDDSLSYSAMKDTKFAIDETKHFIYNPDSLPSKTQLRKLKLTLKCTKEGISKIQLIYHNDSIVNWDSKDSVDFTAKSLKGQNMKFSITAQDKKTVRNYELAVLIHKVDPDSLVWMQMQDLPNTIKKQHTVLSNNTFYTLAVDGSALKVYQADRNNFNWINKGNVNSPLTIENIDIESFTTFNNKFFVLDNQKNAYTSDDAMNWTKRSDNIESIVGVFLGNSIIKDSLIVIKKVNKDYQFAKTIDMSDIKMIADSKVTSDFPSFGFSAITSRLYTSKDKGFNFLAICGGNNFQFGRNYKVWLADVENDGSFNIAPSSNLPDTLNDITPLGYYSYKKYDRYTNKYTDYYFYILSDNQLYRSTNFIKWEHAPKKEKMPDEMITAKRHQVVVDNEKYIWIFGGYTIDGKFVNQVWRGRINKLTPNFI